MSDEGRKRVRSSPYPYYDLEKSIELMQKIYNKVKLYEVPIEVAIEAMELSSTSSTGQRAIAALTMFGLLNQTRKGDKRRVKLSELAQQIIRSQTTLGSKGDVRLLKEAALQPGNMVSYVWDLYSEEGLPDDKLIELQLLNSPDVIVSNVAIDRVISVVRKSLEYAELVPSSEDSNITPTNNEWQTEEGHNTHSEEWASSYAKKPPAALADTEKAELKVYTHPFKSGDVKLMLPQNITEEEMDLLQEWIGFMKKTMKWD